jgi:8-oxo-dGTP pyrophosphatase MutT (NUDIX family)
VSDDRPEMVIPLDRLPPGFAERVAAPPAHAADPKPAATAVLARDGERGPELLLMERHRASGFVPGAWVFPGGRVDDADAAPELVRMLGTTPRGPAAPYWLAMVREVFEETGVLLARLPGGAACVDAAADERLARWRTALLADEATLLDVLEARLKATGEGRDAREPAARLAAGETLFPGIVGYEDTVVPQIVNALLARQNFILLGLRGQAKSRIVRQLVDLLDDEIPILAGSEVNDDPLRPISKHGRCWWRSTATTRHRVGLAGRAVRREAGDAGRDDRRHHRRRRPDQGGARRPPPVRRADHPLRPAAAREPRHLRGQRAAGPGRQDPGRPVQHHAGGRCPDQRLSDPLPLDVLLVFTANPEDYTARGKIITPLKDRIGAEITTHYPRR